MTTFLKQSTAIDVSLGPFLDETDGKTAETGLTITQPDIRLKKNGGAWAQKNAAQTLSHEENGWYEVALDATDTNTVGNLLVAIHESGALPCWREFQVLPANVYDSLIGGTDALQVHANEITAGLITAAAIATGAIDADAIAADAITSAKIADNAIAAAKIATGAITAAKFAAGAIDAAAIADGAIDAGALAADAITAAKVAPDVHAEAADAVWDELKAGHAVADSFGDYLDTEVSGVGGGTPPTAGEIADAVWDEAAADHVGAGSFGQQCGTDIDAILVDTGTTLQGEVDGIQADTEDIQARLPAALVGGKIDANLNAAGLDADAVTEIQSGLALSAQVDALEAAAIAIEADTQDIQGRLPAALVSGRIDASVGAMAANVLTAAALATDAVNEIADGLLSKDVDQVEAATAIHSLASAVLKLVSRFKATTGETFRTDGTTVHMTQTPVNDPVTAISELGVGS
jgi:hypothetical protein